MRKFMFLFSGPRPEEEGLDEHMKKWTTWIEGLSREGKFDSGLPLDPEGKMVSGKKKAISNFSPSERSVGGYLLVNADSLDKAVAIAKTCPIFEVGGTVEVRPTREIPM